MRLFSVATGVLLFAGMVETPVVPLANAGRAFENTTALGACAITVGPEYYAFELVGTNRIPGSGLARGRAEVSVAPSTPFAVALTPDGSYQYQVHLSIDRMRPPRQGVLVAWLTTPDLQEVQRMGVLDQHMQAGGVASWNKFIVVVTLEDTNDASAQRWQGPVVFRGMSRSGKMHTMVGHGALQQENCAAYGYDE